MPVLARAPDGSTDCVAFVASRLMTWPDLVLRRNRRGLVFRARGREIVRMPGDHTAEVLLTAPVIARWAAVLTACGQVTPGSRPGWVTVHVEGPADAELVLSLVSVALKVNQDWLWPASRRIRGTARPRPS
ncbi:hypothetical protein Misp01_00120 [Microtetraspora sp. NBRC 13810]|uniref:luciferase domain-containing protein n=1 Tax=Microtetraspora sp. NBRC 13810 TaxID=3030990 RepID=UPI00249FB719|nr:luciferase family protein [Microtetraspora sp. NBRC 13810]GLW04882.1 hypothetical protein Misp01_00120 [Microtetraspora sp. NBRC 13810]